MEPNTYFLKFITLFLSIFAFFLVPIIFILCIPLFCLRYLVGKIVPLFYPKLGKILTARNSLFAVENIEKSSKSNIVVSVTLEGNIDMKFATEMFAKQGLEATFPNGSLIYPELKQYLITRFGFYFWKNDETFNLSHHIKIHTMSTAGEDRFTDENITEIREELLNKKWERKKPLWEAVVVQNYYPSGVNNSGPHSVCIICSHHCMGDGFAILELFTKRLADNKEDFKNVKPEKLRMGSFRKLIYLLKAPFSISYDIAYLFLMPLLDYPWRVSEKGQKTEKLLTDLSDKIPVSSIIEIKDHFKVSFSSVIFAIIAGAQREMLIRKKLKIHFFTEACVPFPVPNHPGTMRNYASAVIVKLPVGESDPIKRLQLCHKDYQNLKKSTMPLLVFYGAQFYGTFFTWIIKRLGKNKGVTNGLSNFPGGKTTLYACGLNAVDAMFIVPALAGCGGLTVSILSYCDGLRMATVGSSEIFTKQEVRDLTSCFQSQIDLLYQNIV